jgi:phage terminase large subunit GpA-like protein
MSLEQLALETMLKGLNRKLSTSVSKWAERYRIMGSPFAGPWTHDYHPWLIDMADAEEHIVVGQKAAQMGFSEWAINTAFFHIDMHKRKVLYVMPTTADASAFTADRFDPALDMSPHIRSLFSDVNNVSLKTGPYGTLYVRGSHSESSLKSIDVAVVILDEVDEMPERSVNLARRRMSGQTFSKEIQISTPTFPGEGINAAYELSTKDEYWFACPLCDKLITLRFPESLLMTGNGLHDPELNRSRIICTECKRPLPITCLFPDGKGWREEEFDGTQKGCVYYKPWLRHKSRGGTGHMISQDRS